MNSFWKSFSSSRHSRNNTTRLNKSTYHRRNYANNAVHFTAHPELLTFRVATDDGEGPTISIPKLSRATVPPEQIPTWVSQFRLIISSNQWDDEKALMNLKIASDPELHPVLKECGSHREGLKALIGEFFPSHAFAQYENKLNHIKAY